MSRFYIYIFVLFLITSCQTAKHASLDKQLSVSEKDALTFNYSFVEAAKQKMLGNADYAVALYTKCLSIDPRSSAALYELARLNFSAGDLKSSIQKLELACKISPKNVWYWLYLGEVYMKANLVDKTVDTYQKVIQLEPNNLSYRTTLGRYMLMNAKFQDALAVYDAAGKLFGVNESVCVGKSQVFLNLNDREKAVAEIQKLIDAYPDTIKYLGMLAELYNQFHDTDNSLKIYKQLLKKDSTNALVQMSMYNFYRSNQNTEDAYPMLLKFFNNKSGDPQKKVGILLKDYGSQSDISISKFSELLSILSSVHPNDNNVLSVKADQLIRERKYKEAKAVLNSIIEQNPSDMRVWEQIVSLDAQMGDYPLLNKESKTALELYPNVAFFHLYNGISLYFLHNFSDAVKVLLQGLDFAADDQDALLQFYTYLGESYYKLQMYKESSKYFDDALSINPLDTYILNNYSYYLSLRGVDLQKAEAMMIKCIQASPNNATYLDTYGWVLFTLKKYQEARQVQASAVRLDAGRNGILLEHYADILFKCGEIDDALEYWNKALKTGKYSTLLEKKIQTKNYIE